MAKRSSSTPIKAVRRTKVTGEGFFEPLRTRRHAPGSATLFLGPHNFVMNARDYCCFPAGQALTITSSIAPRGSVYA